MNTNQQILKNDIRYSERNYKETYNKALNPGINFPFFSYNTKLKTKKKISKVLDEALKAEDIKVYFMPQYELQQKRIIGAEALARWKVGDEIVNPEIFISLLEEYDLIYDLDIYVLEQCCKWINKWRDNGNRPVPLSVNQSRKNFSKPNYVNNLHQVIAKYEIPAKLINIEITESALFDNICETKEVIQALKEIGFKISIDDFGKGYSSLHLLTEISFHELKIDKCFLMNINESMQSRIILSKIIEMANEVGFDVICEGIETKEQEEIIKEMGCNYAQGFYYAKPMPITRFEALLTLLRLVK